MSRCATATLTLALLALGAWQALRWLPHPDVAFYSTVARQLAEGAQLYHEVGDMNAPPVYWLHLLLHGLAELLGLADYQALVLLYALVALAVLAWLERILAGTGGGLRISRYALLPTLAFLLFLPGQAVVGEREHWALLLVLPQVVATAAFAQGLPPSRRQRLAAAALAGAACLLKPPFLVLALVALELWLAGRRRSLGSLWRAEALAAAAAFLAGAALSLLLHPAYLQRVLPEALTYYVALDKDLLALLRPRGVHLPLLATLGVLLISLCFPLVLRGQQDLVGALAATALGFGAACLLQGKGFDYQWLPVLVLGTAATVAALAAPRGRWVAALLLPLALLPAWALYLAWQQVGSREGAWREALPLAASMRAAGEDIGVFGLAPELYPLFPAVILAGARWLSPESHLWQLDGLYRLQPAHEEPAGFRPPERQGAVEAELRRRLVARFLAGDAELVAVFAGSAAPTLGGSPFSYLDYLLADPVFAAAWEGYRWQARIGDYELYLRAR